MYIFLLSPTLTPNDLNEEANRKIRIGKVCDSTKTFNDHYQVSSFSLYFPLTYLLFPLRTGMVAVVSNKRSQERKRSKGTKVSQTVIGVSEWNVNL